MQPNIIITRPKKQALSLQQDLLGMGVDSNLLPCIEITPLAFEKPNQQFDLIIYISRNAVEHGHELKGYANKVACIGAGTQEALSDYNIHCDIFPKNPPFNSEALLQKLGDKLGKSTLIVKGEGGRDYLEKQLSNVTTIDTYRRDKPKHSIETLLETITPNSLIIFTSKEGLQHFAQLTESTGQIDLKSLQSLVISESMEQLALSLGFKQSYKAVSARNTDIIKCLRSNT